MVFKVTKTDENHWRGNVKEEENGQDHSQETLVSGIRQREKGPLRGRGRSG